MRPLNLARKNGVTESPGEPGSVPSAHLNAKASGGEGHLPGGSGLSPAVQLAPTKGGRSLAGALGEKPVQGRVMRRRETTPVHAASDFHDVFGARFLNQIWATTGVRPAYDPHRLRETRQADEREVA